MVVVVVVGATVVGGRVVGASVGAAKITKIFNILFSNGHFNLKFSIDLKNISRYSNTCCCGCGCGCRGFCGGSSWWKSCWSFSWRYKNHKKYQFLVFNKIPQS